MRRGEPGGRDDDLRREVDELLRRGVERSENKGGADDGHEPLVLLGGRLGEHEHLGAELGERVGGREAGDRHPEDGDPQALPVGMPAGEGIQSFGHFVHPVMPG